MLESVDEVAGPFLTPVVLFVGGAILLLFVLSRRGVLGDG